MNMDLDRVVMFFSKLADVSEYYGTLHQPGGVSCSGSKPLKFIYLPKTEVLQVSRKCLLWMLG